MQFNILLFYLVILNFKNIFSNYTTNSPVFCLLGKTCELIISKDSTENWDDNMNECKLNEDKCSLNYDTTNGSTIFDFHLLIFNVIIFTLNNEDNNLKITIQNYSNLNNLSIMAIIEDDYEYNDEDIILFKKGYEELEGDLFFSVEIDESMIFPKSPDSGSIYFPFVESILYFPNIISTIEEISTTFKIIIQSKDIDNIDNNSVIISNPSKTFNEFLIFSEKENDNLFFESNMNFTFPASHDILNFIITYDTYIFTNKQIKNIQIYPFDISIGTSIFLVGFEIKDTNLNFITEINDTINFEENDFFLMNIKDNENIIEKSIYYSEDNHLLSISYDEYGDYEIYVNYVDYFIKTSAKISILYPIELDQSENERFFSPYKVILKFKNIIRIDNIIVYITKDDNSIETITNFSLQNDGKTLILNDDITESGNYKITINNKQISLDKVDYFLTIYEEIKLEKKYLHIFDSILVDFPTNTIDILLNNESINDENIDITMPSILITITEYGLNNISLKLDNDSIYDVGGIYAISQNYFSLKYSECIIGNQVIEDSEFEIKTDNKITEFIDVSDLYYSYQKIGNDEIIENIFPENKIFKIPFENNSNYIINIYEKNFDNFFHEVIIGPKYTDYVILSPSFKSSIIFYNVTCKFHNLIANNTKEEYLEIECPELINNYLNCSIPNNFTKFGNYSIMYNGYILDEINISGDLTTNDPEIIFNPNILKENKLIDYTLKGNLFDLNQLDYIKFNNIIISNFSYDENNNSKSFSLQLPKGVYKLTIFTKTMQITSLNSTQISVVNSKIISIPHEITLSELDINWIKYNATGNTLNYMFFNDDFELKKNFDLFLISETEKITPLKNDVLVNAKQCVILLKNDPIGIYKILLVNNETNESFVTTDIIIISNNSKPNFDISPKYIIFLNDSSIIKTYLSLEENYSEIIGVKCSSNSELLYLENEKEFEIYLHKNDICYYYTKFGDEIFKISSIDFNIFEYYNQFLIFDGDITINQCYFLNDIVKPILNFSIPKAITVNSDEYFEYVELLHIYLLSKDNVKITFESKSKSIFEAKDELKEGNYNLIIQDDFENYVCNISNFIITNADFDSFGSINYLTKNSTYIIKNLLCSLGFSIYNDNYEKQSCSIESILVNNKYQESIICNDLNVGNYYLYIFSHQTIEYPIPFYRTLINDPDISFSIIKPNSLELIEGIENEIQIKSTDFYIDYIQTITISKEPIIDNSKEEIEYIIFNKNNSKNKINFVAGDYAFFTIESPNENYIYKIISIQDINNNIKNFSDDSFTLTVISCSVIHKQFFIKDINDSIRIISCKNESLLDNILEYWNDYYSSSNNLPIGFRLCEKKNNDLYCYLESDKIKTISIEFFDKNFEIKFNSYEITELCIYMPSNKSIEITLYGEKNESYILSYSGDNSLKYIDSETPYTFQNLNVANSPIRIIVNDIALPDKIHLYNKLNIIENTYKSNKDNFQYFVYLKISDNSFELDKNNMIFLLSNNDETDVINTNCESLNESEYTIKCEFDLRLLGEGNYSLYYKNMANCDYYYNLLDDDFITTLFPEFKIDDSNMIANSYSSLIFISDMNLTNITVKNLNIEYEQYIINNYTLIKNDYNITFLFDLSSKDNLNKIDGIYLLNYTTLKDENEKTFYDSIEVKKECNREKALVNNGKGECKYCIDRNESYPYFDYNSRNEEDSKRCISKCPSSQVSYNNICFDECLNAKDFVIGDINQYIKINNGSCFLFELENVTTEVANLDNQEVIFTFNLNDIIDVNYFDSFYIGSYVSQKCVGSINKILTCIFNFSDIKYESITYDVYFILNNNEKIETNKKVTIKKSISLEICNSLDRYFNTEKINNYCKCKTNKFDENDTCVKICSTSFYDEDQNCLSQCNNYILYEELNLTNHRQCLNSCPSGYDISDNNKTCICNKKIVGNICKNMLDSNPLRNVSPKFTQAIDLVEFTFQFNFELNSSHRVADFYLINDNLKIDGINCTQNSEISYACFFNLSIVTSDTIFEIYYDKNRIYKSLIDSSVTIQVYQICSGLNIRDEYDNFTCKLCKERELETPYFQYYNCVESCDNKTYYRSAIDDYYCVECKDEGTYLYEEENKCVLDCNVLDDKENYEKKKLCVKRTPICPDNYCQNNGECYVINKTLTCECPSLYFGEFCENLINSSNINNINSIIENTALIINDDDNYIYNQSIFEFAQSMRILKKLSTSDDENEKELGIEMFNENENNLKIIEQYTNKVINKVISKELIIKSDTDIKSLITLSSASIFYLTRLIKPELLTNSTSNLRNLNTSELQNELKQLIIKMHQINNLLFLTYEDIITETSTFFQVSEDNMTFFSIWTSDLTSTSDYKIKSLSLNIPILEDNVDSDEPIFYYVETSFSQDVLYCLDKDSASMIAFFSIYNASLIETDINNSRITFPLNTNLNSYLNESAIEFYNKRGIDPYNKSDIAFTEMCYRSTNFDYDLTQEYRREKVYSGISIKSISTNCNYSLYNLREKRLVLICSEFNNNSVGYESIIDPLNKQKVQTLPIKCGKKFKGIRENIAIWLFFSLSFVFIIMTIFLCTTNQNEYLSKALSNDGIAVLEDIGKKVSITERGLESKIDEIYIDFNKKKFWHFFFNNFAILHPLFIICSPSVLSPLYYSLMIFFNEIFNILGYNAVFFNEKKIEKRIYDKGRDNFIYPIKQEFDKIFCSILATIVSTFLLRLLNLTTKSEQNLLKEKVKEDRNEEITSKKGKLRFTAYIIMTFFWIFFWYYCSIFCSMYVNAQYDWLYSSIWSLLFIYIIFAPCCIAIISILEIFKFEIISYYMKRLFIF